MYLLAVEFLASPALAASPAGAVSGPPAPEPAARAPGGRARARGAGVLARAARGYVHVKANETVGTLMYVLDFQYLHERRTLDAAVCLQSLCRRPPWTALFAKAINAHGSYLAFLKLSLKFGFS